jgi:hypothetical protein
MRSLLASLAVAAGCAADPAIYADDVTAPQLPPRGPDALTWLAAGHYQQWHCEPAPHAARPPSPHGTTRICTNDALSAARDAVGPFPVGAAAAIVAYAIYRKTHDAAGGASWYWFESSTATVATSGEGVAGCTGCHGQASHDFVFTAVP